LRSARALRVVDVSVDEAVDEPLFDEPIVELSDVLEGELELVDEFVVPLAPIEDVLFALFAVDGVPEEPVLAPGAEFEPAPLVALEPAAPPEVWAIDRPPAASAAAAARIVNVFLVFMEMLSFDFRVPVGMGADSRPAASETTEALARR